eukprot:6179853-Pleurochrysis_carterae.AAC.1
MAASSDAPLTTESATGCANTPRSSGCTPRAEAASRTRGGWRVWVQLDEDYVFGWRWRSAVDEG